MNSVHEHCSSQFFSKKKIKLLIIKLNKNKIKLDNFKKNKFFVENNVLKA